METNVRNMKSFIEIPENSDFSLHNIPFGVGLIKSHAIQVLTRVGDHVISLSKLYYYGYFKEIGIEENVFENLYLNDFIELGKEKTSAVRKCLQEILQEGSDLSKDNLAKQNAIFSIDKVEMLLPVKVPNYTDFYSSKEHATNVGKLFRDPENALLPNWRHIPVGYHGRASSIIPSGTNFFRPKGQMKPKDAEQPTFGPSKRMDFELEMAFIVGKNTELGSSIPVNEAEEYIFGMVIFNDWSARDIQAWEYVPLGPFLGKNFASSISPWVVTMEALAPFKVESPKPDLPIFPYLQFEGKKSYDIQLQVFIQPKGSKENLVCTSNHKYLYWNMSQQLAHHTVNGCNIEVGDMYASGTISGPEKENFGSMLELSWAGQQPLTLEDGNTRTFLEDGDTVIMRAFSENDEVKVGFGEVRSKILPATHK